MKHLPTAILFFLGYFAHNCQSHDFQPTGKFDLSPKDIVDLCTVVDGTPPAEPAECVYMKWVTCEGGEANPSRPCGWYQQTKCAEGRKKREAGEEAENVWTHDQSHSFNEEVYLGWPDEQ